MPSKLDNYTSTGKKFWLHPEKLENYRQGDPHTIISTHISPEGACNLDCSYCSVHKRTQSERLQFHEIVRYISKMMDYGLKAVILTGGGEPTSYKHFNLTVEYLKACGLKVGLITNGTLANRVDVWDMLDWVRVSINVFDGWEQKISIPKLDCTVGCSYIYTGDDVELDKVADKASELGAKYIRVLPDCRHENLPMWHEKIDSIFDDRFMHQYKIHSTPNMDVCHQSYFRPYLHESGWVFPCDSVVLNNSPGMFLDKYRLCRYDEIDEYLKGNILPKFTPRNDCHGCVFSDNLKLLDTWVKTGEMGEIEDLEHADFV